MRRSMLSVATVAGVLGGCASVPPIDEQDYIRVSNILYSTECELKEAIDGLKETYTLNRQLIDVTYSLNVLESGTGDGTGNLVVPIANGTFSIGLTASVKQTNTRNTEFKIRYSSDKLSCPESTDPSAPQRIDGSLGLAEWLGNAALALEKVRRWPLNMTYNMDFTIERNGSMKPAFGLKFPSGHEYGGSLSLAGSRKVAHGIEVIATDIKPGDLNGVEAGRRLDLVAQQTRFVLD
ncbi:MAG: hypothetical protein R3D57_11405 [Hyphomicrobiaceae bacterium]